MVLVLVVAWEVVVVLVEEVEGGSVVVVDPATG
jgi:hypothetical protein